ncbi:MAG: two-component system response regulator [Acidobacteria bacterium]|nr:MAG: two-component system response regulator [Acidobacteriota bacterium]
MNELLKRENPGHVLIVDDDPKNVKLLKILCQGLGYECLEAVNGREALEHVQAESVDVILLDLMMPVMNGFQVLDELKKNPEKSHIPVIIVTALDSREQRLRGIEAGADDFLAKPVDADELALRLRNNMRVKEHHDFLAHFNQRLEEEVAARTMELNRAVEELRISHREIRESRIETIRRLTLASEYKDEETGEHIQRTGYYCRTLAEELGLDEVFQETIFHAAPMHDIGKVAIPDSILLKPGPLNQAEWAEMQSHTTFGGKILENSRSDFLVMARDIALGHHERWDGGGYPQGLSGEAIPLSARIMNLADQYDALRSKRPYKPPFDHGKTCHILTEGDGRTMPEHFDPQVLDAFRRVKADFAQIFETHSDTST